MSYVRSETWPEDAGAVRRRLGGRMLAHYLTDLAVSVFLVLALGWIVQASADDLSLRNALIAQNDIYRELSRFTPRNLFFDYLGTLDRMMRSAIFGYHQADGLGGAIRQALLTIAELLLNLLLAVPRTLMRLYQETGGTAAWIVLAGFGMAVGTIFTCLLRSRRSVARLAVAAVLTPVAMSGVFLLLQAFMLLMLDTFFWFTRLAPYTVVCPVLCTLYWVAFPRADRGATAMVARAIMRALEVPR